MRPATILGHETVIGRGYEAAQLRAQLSHGVKTNHAFLVDPTEALDDSPACHG